MATDDTKPSTFFDAAYSKSERSILAEVRRAAFGEDIGQFSLSRFAYSARKPLAT
jgi:hypothetical protein